MIGVFRFPIGELQGWDYQTGVGKLNVPQATYDRLRELLPDLPADPATQRIGYAEDYTGPIEAVVELVPIEVRKLYRDTAAASAFQAVADKPAENLAREPERSFNEKCNVHVPGLGLLAIDEVKLIEDACTDLLKGHLEDGWRIIAACPQPDQRRPDYVLGRSSGRDSRR